MILKVEVPFLESSLKGGIVSEWHKTEGERVDFGEVICTIAVDEWLGLRRDKRASVIAGIGGSDQRDLKRLNRFEWRNKRGMMFLEVVASEPATLKRILSGQGARVEVGDVLALASTGDTEIDEDLDVDPRGIPSLRTVARAAEVTEEEVR